MIWKTIDFLQTYNGAVTAAATVFIGMFTLVLAIVSRTQANLTRRSVRIAERALVELERPFVYVEVTKSGIKLDGSFPFAHRDGNLEFQCINHGRTPADLWELKEEIRIVDKDKWPDPILPGTDEIRGLPPGTVASQDRPFQFTIN